MSAISLTQQDRTANNPIQGYRYSAPFAGVVEAVDNQLRSLPPAAGALWRELRRHTVPGREHEFDLQALADKLGYSLRWLRYALKELEAAGLLEITRQWWKQLFRCRIIDPGIEQKTSSDRQKTSSSCSKTSKKQPLNTDSLVPIQVENFKDQQTALVEDEQGRLVDRVPQTPISEQSQQPTATTAIKIVRDAGIPINPTIQQTVISAIDQLGQVALARIQDATKVASEAPETRKDGTPTNRQALFVQALKHSWKPRGQKQGQGRPPGSDSSLTRSELPAADPSRTPEPQKSPLPPGFNDWFELAKSAGIAIGSEYRDGEIWIHTCSSTCEPFSQMQKMYPLVELQELATLRDSGLDAFNE